MLLYWKETIILTQCTLLDINECANPDACLGSGNCTDTENAFDCKCYVGFTGGSGGPCAGENTDKKFFFDAFCDNVQPT